MRTLRNVTEIQKLIDSHDAIVFLGGAGVSTESGIPDFRGANGIYNEEFAYPAEHYLSHNFFMNRPKEFFEFYQSEILHPDAKPNQCHRYLYDLEKANKLKAVITQNIDGLHQKAGSKNVLELHGTVHDNHCVRCGKAFSLKEYVNSYPELRCDACGGLIKPDVVLYGEMLPQDVLQEAIKSIEQSDLLIVGGTSLNVAPASELHTFAAGKTLLINKTKTSKDIYFDFAFYGKIAETCDRLTI